MSLNRPIIFGTTRFPPETRSGVETMGMGLVEGLSAAGQQVVVVTSGAQRETSILPGGAQVHRFSAAARQQRFWMIGSILTLLHGRRITHVVKRPAAVICSSPQYVPWARAGFSNVPVLFICHGLSKVSSKIEPYVAPISTWRIAAQIRFADKIRYIQELMAYRLAHRVIALSEGVRADLMSIAAVPAKKIVVIPNGVDRQFLDSQGPDRDPRDELRVLFVGRLSQVKNVMYLLEALRRLPQSPAWKCRIVGDGVERRALEQFALEKGLSRQVTFTGWSANVGQDLAWGNVFVNPSRWEGCSMAVLEAMACGLPCLVPRPDGQESRADYTGIIEAGRNGVLIDGRDPSTLAEALRVLAQDGATRLAMGQESRRIASERFAWDVIARQYLDVIQAVSCELGHRLFTGRHGSGSCGDTE